MADSRDIESLPTQDEFDPSGCCLDANHASKVFGGLTVEEASIKFSRHPREKLRIITKFCSAAVPLNSKTAPIAVCGRIYICCPFEELP